MGGTNIWQLLIITVIVVLLFDTKKLDSTGSDLDVPIKGFEKVVGDDEPKQDKANQDADFTVKSITDRQGKVKKEDVKSQGKGRA